MASYASFKDKLDILGCPFVEEASEDVARELLFSPGEHRLRLLQWLLGKIDSNIFNHIEKQPKYAGKDDWRYTNLQSACSAFGLTNPGDLDLVTGTASEDKQAFFFEKLFNMAIVMDRVESADRLAGQAMLKEQFLRDSAFLTQAISQNSKIQAFPQAVQLLPLDITRLVHENWKEKGWRPGDRVPVPDRKYLTRLVVELNERLQKETRCLSELKQSKDYSTDNLDETAKSCIRSRYSLVLGGLDQILTDFSYCFANYLEVWCNSSAELADEDELGPVVKQANKLFGSLSKVIEDLRSLALLPAELQSSLASIDGIQAKLQQLEKIQRNFEFTKVLTKQRQL